MIQRTCLSEVNCVYEFERNAMLSVEKMGDHVILMLSC